MAISRRKWTASEENLIKEELSKHNALNASFMTVATKTGRSVGAVHQHYLSMKSRSTTPETTQQVTHEETVTTNKSKRWTEEEEQRLIMQVTVFPQNLNRCFVIVSEVIGRSSSAVAAHWYAVTSKRPDVKCFFTASSKHIALNRKNGEGIPSTESIWRKLLRVVNRLIK